jgi:hypothetical protein
MQGKRIKETSSVQDIYGIAIACMQVGDEDLFD